MTLALAFAGLSFAQTSKTYTYDALGRLTAVTNNGAVTTYAYDPAGNRTSVVSTPGAPTAGPVSLNVAYNTAGTVALAPGGNFTSLAVASGPTHGTASISGTNVTYTPTTGYYGADSFTYTATGPGGTSAAATVSVAVGVPAPTAGNVGLTTAYNTAGAVGLAPGGSYTSLAVATAPSHGSASISGTTATYTPTSGYYGADSFTYTATGTGGTSSPGTVSVTVSNPAAPTVGNVGLTTAYNTAGSVALTPTGIYSSLAVATSPSHGSASISGTTATYTPTSGYYGADSFTYVATGPGGTSAAATVSVAISIPAAPTAANVSANAAFNTPTTIALAPGGVYNSIAVVSAAAHGTVALSGTTVTYQSSSSFWGASDSFTYNVTGPGGTSAAALVTVAVGNPPAPTVSSISPTVTYTNGSFALPISGLFNSVGFPTGPAHGVITASGSTAYYYPQNSYFGIDTFTYNATGPGGVSNTATISLTVTRPPAPTVSNTSMTVGYNSTGSIVLPVSGIFMSVQLASGAANGLATVFGAQSASYTPHSNWSGSDSFTYSATGPGGTSAATVYVTVPAPPPGPLTVTPSSTTWSATKVGTGSLIASPSITLTIAGGTAPYPTAVWQLVSGDTSTTESGSTTATWIRTLGPNGSWTSVWRCKVTDAAGNVAYSPNITVTFSHQSS